MKIQINHTVREMTEDEIQALTPDDNDEAMIEDYENSLSDLGVRLGD